MQRKFLWIVITGVLAASLIGIVTAGTSITVYGYVAGPAIPDADFSADPVAGTAPLQVRFMDTSSGTVTGWAWDFENDGKTDSSLKNPVAIYYQAGNYSVNLTVFNAAGSASIVKTEYIQITKTNPAQAISALRQKIDLLPLPVWTKRILDWSLDPAQHAVSGNDMRSAQRSMKAFIDMIRVFRGLGLIDANTANQLTKETQDILSML
jgi:hypothetical protein